MTSKISEQNQHRVMAALSKKRAAHYRRQQALQSVVAASLPIMTRPPGRPGQTDYRRNWATWFNDQIRPYYERMATHLVKFIPLAKSLGLVTGAIGGTGGNPRKKIESWVDPADADEIYNDYVVLLPREFMKAVDAFATDGRAYWYHPYDAKGTRPLLSHFADLKLISEALQRLADLDLADAPSDFYKAQSQARMAANAMLKVLARAGSKSKIENFADRLMADVDLRGRPGLRA